MNKTIPAVIIGIVIVVSIIVFLVYNSSYNTPNLDNTNTPENSIDFSTLKEGYQNEIKTKQERVITTSEEWADLWTEMFPTEMIASAIDFEEKMIIAVFQGEKNTGGYSIEITEIIEKDNSLKVYIKETVPGENCILTQALTSPYHIVELDKTDKEIKFMRTQSTTEC